MNTTEEQRRASAAYIEKGAGVVVTFPAQFILGLIADVEELKARLAQYECQEGLGK